MLFHKRYKAINVFWHLGYKSNKKKDFHATNIYNIFLSVHFIPFSIMSLIFAFKSECDKSVPNTFLYMCFYFVLNDFFHLFFEFDTETKKKMRQYLNKTSSVCNRFKYRFISFSIREKHISFVYLHKFLTSIYRLLLLFRFCFVFFFCCLFTVVVDDDMAGYFSHSWRMEMYVRTVCVFTNLH